MLHTDTNHLTWPHVNSHLDEIRGGSSCRDVRISGLMRLERILMRDEAAGSMLDGW